MKLKEIWRNISVEPCYLFFSICQVNKGKLVLLKLEKIVIKKKISSTPIRKNRH